MNRCSKWIHCAKYCTCTMIKVTLHVDHWSRSRPVLKECTFNKILYRYTWEKKSCPFGTFWCTSFMVFIHVSLLTHWLLELFAKNTFFGPFDDSQIQSNQKGICNMIACLSFLTRIAIYNIYMYTFLDEEVTLKAFFICFSLSFFSFSYLFVPVIDLLLGLLLKISGKTSLRQAILRWNS